jgi:hypothetical protein
MTVSRAGVGLALRSVTRVYAQARPGYHAITQQAIDLVLKWDEVTAKTPDKTP